MNLTKRACCQLVLLLNDTSRVPPCHENLLMEEYNNSLVTTQPIWLSEPEDVQEDHATFLLGILILMIIAIGCTFTLSKLTKPKISIGYGNVSNYDFMMWMPSSRSNRRSSMLVLLRGIACRRAANSNRNSDISVVSSNVGLLPSYQTATSSPLSLQPPPPPYSEVRTLTDNLGLSSSA
ncbi:unnamed protein product [Auanema sp. JU1783]|nr:unnamed protein product [Auanema sp. JU1783]